MMIGGVFGPKYSGKTTLARSISREYWTRCKMRTLVLDPNNDDWTQEKQAKAFTDEAAFWQAVWSTRGCLIVVEESAATIRRERTLVPVFTRIRHYHKLLVIGHNGTDLLPVMREQIDVIYLFRMPMKAAALWAETFTDVSLIQSVSLQQFEFIRGELWHFPAVRMRLPGPLS